MKLKLDEICALNLNILLGQMLFSQSLNNNKKYLQGISKALFISSSPLVKNSLKSAKKMSILFLSEQLGKNERSPGGQRKKEEGALLHLLT